MTSCETESDAMIAKRRALGFDEKAFASRLTVTQSVEQLLHTIDNLTSGDTGRYLNTDGKPIPF